MAVLEILGSGLDELRQRFDVEIALTSSRPPAAAIDASGDQPPVRPIDPVNPYVGNAPDR